MSDSASVIPRGALPCAGEHDPLAAPLKVLVRHAPVTCLQTTPVREALEIMRRHQVGSILVVDRHEHPAGLFTLRDLRDRVVLGGYDVAEPIGGVMSPRPYCLSLDAPALEAALGMVQRSIRHVVLTDGEGRVAGVISERDLFALQQTGVSRLASTLRNAAGLEELPALAEDIRGLARNLMAQGVGAEQLTRLISELNDHLAQRIIQFCLPAAVPDGVRWCWLALGSEGRYEQTLLTDQDNGLLFSVPEGESAEAIRQRLLPAARAVNEWLARCGFPLCAGGIMASNPQWCLSEDEWRVMFGDWLFRADAPELLNASIFFDFRALAGTAALAESLRAWLNQRVKDNRPFLKQMVGNALGKRVPLGFVRDFALDDDAEVPHSLDLKSGGVAPFVDVARVFALAVGLADTGSAERLRRAAEAWRLDAAEARAWVEAFHFIQQLRIRLQYAQVAAGKPLRNRLDPDELGAIDRLGLKEALRQAKKLQGRLESFFQF